MVAWRAIATEKRILCMCRAMAFPTLHDASLQSKPFVEHGYEYLDKAFGWGGNHGIGILLDLHAAPGSQV